MASSSERMPNRRSSSAEIEVEVAGAALADSSDCEAVETIGSSTSPRSSDRSTSPEPAPGPSSAAARPGRASAARGEPGQGARQDRCPQRQARPAAGSTTPGHSVILISWKMLAGKWVFRARIWVGLNSISARPETRSKPSTTPRGTKPATRAHGQHRAAAQGLGDLGQHPAQAGRDVDHGDAALAAGQRQRCPAGKRLDDFPMRPAHDLLHVAQGGGQLAGHALRVGVVVLDQDQDLDRPIGGQVEVGLERGHGSQQLRLHAGWDRDLLVAAGARGRRARHRQGQRRHQRGQQARCDPDRHRFAPSAATTDYSRLTGCRWRSPSSARSRWPRCRRRFPRERPGPATGRG